MYLLKYEVQTLLGSMDITEELSTIGEVRERVSELGVAGYTCRVFKEIEVTVKVEVSIYETD